MTNKTVIAITVSTNVAQLCNGDPVCDSAGWCVLTRLYLVCSAAPEKL